MAIPLVTMLGLFAVVSYTSITGWLNLDRAPNLINATSVPITRMVNLLQAERRAAVVYLSRPDNTSLTAYRDAVAATTADLRPLDAALDSAGTKSSESAQEAAAIATFSRGVAGLDRLRAAVSAQQVTPLAAFAGFTKVINDAPVAFQFAAASLTNSTAAIQGVGLVATVTSHEDLQEQNAILAGALASGTLTPADRVVFSQADGREQDAVATFTAVFSRSELDAFDSVLNKLAPPATQNQLAAIQQAVVGGAPLAELEAGGLTSAGWQQLTATVANANYQAGLASAAKSLAVDRQNALNAKQNVIITAAIGAAGLILTLIITILLGRSVNLRLSALRRAALTLAERQLPSVVARLRRGEGVDIAAEAPPLRVGTDEIGQVGQSIDIVRQTALRAAVDESRLRQGVNDMFRNLARRNQSLLQRQLGVLDAMERRATDPDLLDDLFRMDHLTTRMRRHAEGLIILSGAAPGRGWSAPVRLIDVMRGAVAEIEDYARVVVATQARASLAGAAVTDVIHLLAELIENATTLSPPFTQVRVSGEAVANGFAIEIEDRGLGMTPTRMAELNERLANPPDVNPANTEQLGLFVVGQLAKRNGIKVTLRPSPYGGVTAIVMIPQQLIVDPGPHALTAGPAAGRAAFGNGADRAAFGNGADHLAFGNGAERLAFGNGHDRNANAPGGGAPVLPGRQAPDRAEGAPIPAAPFVPAGSPPDLDNIPLTSPFSFQAATSAPAFPAPAPPTPAFQPPAPPAPTGQRPAFPGPAPSAPAGPGMPPSSSPDADAGGRPDIRISGAVRHSAAGAPAGNSGSGPADVPVVTGVPLTLPGADDREPNAFPPRPGPEQEAARYPDFGGSPHENGEDDEDYKGLPRRVRQANLAPQLRSARHGGGTQVPPATASSPADLRNTLSAMQRGWQLGRSKGKRNPEDTDGN